MNPLVLSDGTIISLNFVRALIPYTDGSYRLMWSSGEMLDMTGPNAVIMTNYLTAHAVTVKPTLVRPPAPTLAP